MFDIKSDGSFMEQFLAMQQASGNTPVTRSESAGAGQEVQPAPTAAPSAAPSDPPAPEPSPAAAPVDAFADEPEFVASSSWDGPRPGFVFKLGEGGQLGYHIDVPLLERQRKQQEAARAKPVVLKSASIVKVQPRKLVGGPDAKKRKLGAARMGWHIAWPCMRMGMHAAPTASRINALLSPRPLHAPLCTHGCLCTGMQRTACTPHGQRAAQYQTAVIYHVMPQRSQAAASQHTWLRWSATRRCLALRTQSTTARWSSDCARW